MIYMAKPQIGDEEKQAVMEVLDSGIIAQGPRTKAFEEGFAKMCGVDHAIATSSGTTALHVAMLAQVINASCRLHSDLSCLSRIVRDRPGRTDQRQ